MARNKKQDDIDIKELIAAEEELQELKEKYGLIEEKEPSLFEKFMGLFANKEDVTVSKKKYVLLMVFTGIFGGHRFYAKQYIQGILYLLTCWCGISLAMTIIDVLVIVPMVPDENGMVTFHKRQGEY